MSVIPAVPEIQFFNYSGVKWSIFIGIGLFFIILSLAAFLVVRNRPEDLGFAPPNSYGKISSTPQPGNWLLNLAGVVSVLHIWPGFWVQFGMIGSLYSFMGLWGIPYLRDVHGWIVPLPPII